MKSRGLLALLIWLSLFFLVLAASAQAQMQPSRDVRVGLRWLVLPQEVTVTPRAAGAVMRSCAGCAPARMTGSVTFTAQENALNVTGAKSPSTEIALAGDYEIALPGRPPLHVSYSATLRARGGGIRIVLRIPLEDYVVLALTGESADFTSDAALQAMAVVVRTYAVSQRGRHAAEDFDLCDTTHCQLLRFAGEAPPRLRSAAAATEGELLWYRGQPAVTFYSRNCAGTTEDGASAWPGIAAPYLRSHPDPYCVIHGRNEWNAEIRKSDLAAALRDTDAAAGGASVTSLRILARTPSGRVAQIEIGGAGVQVMTGENFRTAVARALGSGGLRSNAFDVSDAGDRFIFHGYGAGHGAGLCQAGAQEMGVEGKTYREILAFYYPGTAAGLTAQGLEWVRLGGERLEVMTARPDSDGALVARADRALREAESRTGWQLAVRPELRVYPTVSVYRNATGEPGWVAASTRGHTVRLEPPEVLNSAGVLDATLRHEFLHLLIESRARPGLPLWFREGLALYLNGEVAPGGAVGTGPSDFAALDRALVNAASAGDQRSAYGKARAAVARLVAERGRDAVLSWVERGVPPDAMAH